MVNGYLMGKLAFYSKTRCFFFKREEFYLNEYKNVKELRKAIGVYIEFYNQRRWHQSLGYKTPAAVRG